MADLITTLGNRDKTLIDDFSIAPDTAYSSQKIEELLRTFDSVVRCSIALTEPVGTESEYDSAYLTIVTGEIGERVLVTAPNGLGVVLASSGTVYTIKTVYVCTWEALTGKPFETVSEEDFTVDNGMLRYVDTWSEPINEVDERKQDQVPASGSAGTGRYAGKRDPLSGDSVWEELDEFSLVNSVNGVFPENMPVGKNVQLDGADINVDDAAGSPVTVKDAITALDAQIAAESAARVNADNTKQDKIPAAVAGYVATHSGTAGVFGTPVNPAAFTEAALTDAAASSTLPAAGLISVILQTVRNCLKWLVARFDASGNANTALKLTTPRTIQTNLAAAAAASFDGSANITPGVTGILPIANGGTGSSTGNTTGTAAAATKLATARTLTANPAATAAASFDGSANVSIGIAPNLTDGTAAAALPAAGTATALTTLLNTIRNCLKWLVARFDASGNANTALKLTTPRTIQTNLAAAAAASFDGSANITPGVTGILPIANGGTGRNDNKAAALVTPRTIALSGDASGSAAFDGSGNITIPVTVQTSGITEIPPASQTIRGGAKMYLSGATLYINTN